MFQERERLEQFEQAWVFNLASMAERWEKTRRRRTFLDAVKEKAIRRQVPIDAVDGFVRWLDWVEQYLRAIDAPGDGSPTIGVLGNSVTWHGFVSPDRQRWP